MTDYAPVQTYWLIGTETVRLSLRRYHYPEDDSALVVWDCAHGYHTAETAIGTADATYDGAGFPLPPPHVAKIDPRWPATCDRCAFVFAKDDAWQTNSALLYRRADDLAGAHPITLREAGPGAMWDAPWLRGYNRLNRPGDGLNLMVRLPNGHDWSVDSRSSNCTRPDEPHSCWVRHGDPRTEPVTVDKAGETCSAGAGSILSGDYHGFLRNGWLEAC